MATHQVVIVGAGFAGIWAALGAAAARRAAHADHDVEITVIAPGESLLIRPRLYERDLGGVQVPLRGVLPEVQVQHLDGMVERLLPEHQLVQVVGNGGDRQVPYDQLVICSGSRRAFRLDDPRQHGVDDLTEATGLHAALDAFGSTRPLVAVVGAGFAGLEVATELAQHADVHLIERAGHVAPDFGPAARAEIEAALRKLNIAVTVGLSVHPVDNGALAFANGTYLSPNLTVWATGPQAGTLGRQLGIEPDEFGRIPVSETLHTGVAGVWAAGDCARALVDGEHPAMMSCQQAMPMGSCAGANAVNAVLGRAAERYSQPLYLTCLDLGAAGALLTAGFERDDVIATGTSGKEFKRFINRGLIYPPSGDARELLKLGAARPANRAAAALQRRSLHSAMLRRSVVRGVPDRASRHLAG